MDAKRDSTKPIRAYCGCQLYPERFSRSLPVTLDDFWCTLWEQAGEIVLCDCAKYLDNGRQGVLKLVGQMVYLNKEEAYVHLLSDASPITELGRSFIANNIIPLDGILQFAGDRACLPNVAWILDTKLPLPDHVRVKEYCCRWCKNINLIEWSDEEEDNEVDLETSAASAVPSPLD